MSTRSIGGSSHTIILHQLLLGGGVLLGTGTAIALDQVRNFDLLVLGASLIFTATAVAVLLPWPKLPYLLSACVPAVDMVAIALLRPATTGAGMGVLWVFPAMWVAWSFGLVGTIAACVAITALTWGSILIDPGMDLSASAFIIPVASGGIAVIAYRLSQRTQAQRLLVERRSNALQRTAEHARRQEELVTDVLDGVDFGVVRVSVDGAAIIANEAHLRLQNLRDLAGEQAYRADGTTRLPLAELPLRRAVRGETFENELVWYGEPGEDRHAIVTTARRLVDGRGQSSGSIVVSRDVTAEQLAIRARDDLIASVSHELRTPLTSVFGHIELALDDPSLTASTRQGLEVAERNAERLLTLIGEQLVSAVAAGGGTPSMEFATADLAPIILHAVEALGPRLVARGMTIDTSAVEHVYAEVDASRVRQVIDNLLSNAVKYGREGGRIEVGCTSEGAEAFIVVRDDGPGITATEQRRIFERFFRSETVRGTSVHGSGLGLAISRDIVRAHGGDIVLKSGPGEGASFLVRQPLQRAVETKER